MEIQKSEMKSKILLSEVETIINKTYFHNDGDASEKEWWTFFKERFPNCENFWRHFIVPFTSRVDPKTTNPISRVYARDDVSEDIKTMGTFHYSTLKKLIYAYDHLQNFGMSSFEDFYIHIASACDCAEEFLLRVYLVTLECRGEQSYILQKLKKDEFLVLAGDWYDKNYSNVYKNYLKKGKFSSIPLPGIKNMLEEYFDNSREWKEYNKYSQKIREYRNAIVHNVQIGRILLHNHDILVPKKEKIQNYKKLSSVFQAGQNIQKIKSDFINMKEQMIIDIGTIEIIFNKLWNKPIDNLKTLLFKDKNKTLLKKYHISLT